jgi:hypothetical protein
MDMECGFENDEKTNAVHWIIVPAIHEPFLDTAINELI